MFLPKKLDKYTNYNAYLAGNSPAYEVDKLRLAEVIGKLKDKYKRPYIRFIWNANADEAMCITYLDFKKGERLMKLIPFRELEVIVNNLTEE